MDRLRVSVVIPTQGRAHLRDCLTSVQNQTIDDFEIIIVQDGPASGLERDMLQGLGRTVRVLEQEYSGVGAARNLGLSVARGEYVAFLDDDDLWPEAKLEWQADFLDGSPEVQVVAGVAEHFGVEDGLTTGYVEEIDFRHVFKGCPFVSPGQTMIRVDACRKVGGFRPGIWGADDWDLWFRMARVRPLVMQNRIGLYYRRHSGNASNDIRRLLVSCGRVTRTYLRELPPEERTQTTRMVCKMLYGYLGVQVIRMLGADAKRCRISEVVSSAKTLAWCTPFAFR